MFIKMKFTEEETCRLLKLYMEYECLWDLGSVYYRNKTKRLAAEEEIVVRFGKTGFGVGELKRKIKNLRCTYNQECTKIQKLKESCSESKDVYVPSLKWFPIIDQIVKTAKANKKSENFEESVFQEPSTYIVEEEIHGIDAGSYQDTALLQQVMIATETPSVKRSYSGKAGKETPQLKNKKFEHSFADAVKSLRQVSESLSHEKKVLSEQEAFGNYVGATLKNLPTRKALLAQHEIQGILLKHRLSVTEPDEVDVSTASVGCNSTNTFDVE